MAQSELATGHSEHIPAIPKGDLNDRSFWRKLRKSLGELSADGLEKALMLYYAARRPDTPKWAKATVFGALGYFVMPIDSIPDFTPGIGFSDDFMIISAALATIALHINKEVKTEAKQAVDRLLARRQHTEQEQTAD